MWIDDRQAIINDVIISCEDAANHYEDAVNIIDDVSLKHLFESFCDEHKQFAGKLAEIMRATGELPRSADIEQEQILILWSRIKAALAEDKREIVLNEMIKKETQIQSQIGTALQLDLQPDTAARLNNINNRLNYMLQELRKHL